MPTGPRYQRPSASLPRRVPGGVVVRAAIAALALLGLAATGAAAQASAAAQAAGAAHSVAPSPTAATRLAAIARAAAVAREGAGRDAHRLLDSLVAAAGLPGLSAAVGVHGRIVWAEGFGFADVENRIPVTPLTEFRVGSVSKSLTSAALGLLVQEGKIDLDAPVQRYVPSFPNKRWPVTTREVAGHLAGIRHYRGDEFLSSRHYPSVDSGLSIFEHDTLLFEPGTKFHYSTYGWDLVSAVIEGASGQAFLDYMREHVLEPLDLRETVADQPDSLVRYRARPYDMRDDGTLLNSPWVDNSYKWAGGGYLSTPSDLARYATRLDDGDLLDPSTVRLLFTSEKTSSGEVTHYGMGWFTRPDSEGRRTVYHSGGSVGGTTFLLLYPDEGVAVAFTMNVTPSRAVGKAMKGASLGDFAQALARPYLAAVGGPTTP